MCASENENPGVLLLALAARLPGRVCTCSYKAKAAGWVLDLVWLRPKWVSGHEGGTAEENGCGISS